MDCSKSAHLMIRDKRGSSVYILLYSSYCSRITPIPAPLLLRMLSQGPIEWVRSDLGRDFVYPIVCEQIATFWWNPAGCLSSLGEKAVIICPNYYLVWVALKILVWKAATCGSFRRGSTILPATEGIPARWSPRANFPSPPPEFRHGAACQR